MNFCVSTKVCLQIEWKMIFTFYAYTNNCAMVQWGAIKISPLLIWTLLGSLGDNLIRWPFEPFMSSEPNQKQARDLSPFHIEPYFLSTKIYFLNRNTSKILFQSFMSTCPSICNSVVPWFWNSMCWNIAWRHWSLRKSLIATFLSLQRYLLL